METVGLRRFGPDDAAWLVARHAVLYAREAGFDASFGELVEEIVAGFLADHDPAREAGLIAVEGGTRIGSIFCVRGEAADDARLRLFLLEPEVRGRGIGQRLLDACLDFARSAGYRRMALRTHESHRAAGVLYQRNGFDLVASRAVKSFGQALVEQRWERVL